MNGAEALLGTARAAGIDLCLANPGTTELPLVCALDAAPDLRAVLGLFEGVCTGAADGFGRMTGRPALVLLHLGPGFANGIANLHNARRAHTPVVVVIGDHATWHRGADAPLSSDIVSLARPVSTWVGESRRASELAADLAEAVERACAPPGGVASLIVPSDCQQEPAPAAVQPKPSPARRFDPARVESVARALHGDAPTALLLGGSALREEGLRAAARVARVTGATLVSETFPARLERGGDLPRPTRLPYFPEQALEALSGFRRLVRAGAREPIAFFAVPGVPGRLLPEHTLELHLAGVEEDCSGALDALADALGAPARAPAPEPLPRPGPPRGALDPASLGAVLSALQPEGAIVVDEGATSGLPYFLAAAAAPRHSYLSLTGGAIGQGLPCATGAALACPDRRVVALQADGSASYTFQALWTQARESLDVTTVLCANHRYRILQVELMRAGIAEPGPAAMALTELSRPKLDWVELAGGMGVPAVRVERADALGRELARSLETPGPSLIEACL